MFISASWPKAARSVRIPAGLGVLILCTAVQAQPKDATLEQMPRDIVAAETLATFEPGTFIENLLSTEDGSLLLTSYYDRRVLRYRSDIGVRTEFQLPGHPVSIATDTDGTLYMVVHGKSFRSGPDFVKTNQVWRWRRGSEPEPFVEASEAQFLNGIARVADGTFLIADSLAGTVWRLDIARRRVDRWLSHVEFESTAPQQLRPGANGIRKFGNKVLVANSTRRSLIEIDLMEGAAPGRLTVRAVDVPTDDFAVAQDGTVFSATHRDQIVRIRPDGSKQVIAEHSAVKGSTSAVFGSGEKDREAIYVVNDGGLFFGQKEPPAIVRLWVGVPGSKQ